ESAGGGDRALRKQFGRVVWCAARHGQDRPRYGSHPGDRRSLGGRNLSPAYPVLLDTCAAIWLMNADPMAPQSIDAILAAQAQNAGVFVSPITAWEIATLVARNRV